MGNFYEVIQYDEGLPIKAFIHSVRECEMHFHNALEILFVLEGSVNIKLGGDLYTLEEEDLILINSNQLHSSYKTNEDNITLVLQINLDYFSKIYPGAKSIRFEDLLLGGDRTNDQVQNLIRAYIAEIVWQINKKPFGYQLVIGSKLNLLASVLLSNYEFSIVEGDSTEDIEDEIKRLYNILNYISDNLENKITLKQIADRENINSYYLSHFFKRKVGIGFQEYLNTKRLERAFKLLLNTDMTIIDIANKSGFSSTNYFNKVFKKAYNSLPSENRVTIDKSVLYNLKDDVLESENYFNVVRTTMFEKLYSYMNSTNINPVSINAVTQYSGLSSKESISLNLDGAKELPLINHWQKLTSFGRASEGLRSSWQDQLRQMQREIGFEYIRFHGIFSDDMMIYDRDSQGKIHYNWSYVDELFDFFKEVNIKPFVELGFMPWELKSSDHSIFWWNANISQPNDINLWTDLVKEFIKHCINRYGLAEVEKWYFEVWNEPSLEGIFWIGGKEDYLQFYKDTSLAVKSISPNLKVGGPSITHQVGDADNWLGDFLAYCRKNTLPLDFVSIHIYPEIFGGDDSHIDLLARLESGEDIQGLTEEFLNIKRLYSDENNTIRVLDSAREEIKLNLKEKAEIHVTEWNASSYNRNLIHDTAFLGTFIVDNVLRTLGKTDSLGYWTFTDLYEEFKVDKAEFHGNFGMISKSGLKKPSYYAYYLLSKLGNTIVKQGDEYIITKNGESIQILAYNYTYFNEVFMKGDLSALTNKKRYDIYQAKPPKEIDISVRGVNGSYKITNYQLNIDSGSVFDEWLKMGAPKNMSREEIDYLKGISIYKMSVKSEDIVEEYKDKITIPIHGVELITLEPAL